MNKLSILHVEDDVIMAMEIKEFLEGESYEVYDTVCTGAEAVQSVRAHNPDVVLMDIRLKGEMSGAEAAREIRTFCGAPIVFISGYKDTGMVDDIKSIPNSFFVSKPIDLNKLITTIEKFHHE